MRLSLQSIFTSSLLCFFTVGFSGLQAGSPRDRSSSKSEPAALVAEALQAEASGDFLERKVLLKNSGEFEPAMWHDGKLQSGKKWQSVDESIKQAQSNGKLSAYLRRRENLGGDAASHLELAQWCAKNGLEAQSRAHLEHVILLEPDNAEVRKALGHQRIGQEWITKNEWQRLQEEQEFAKASFRKYRSILKRLQTRLSSKRPTVNELALATLEDLQRPDAVPCLESILANPGASPEILAKGIACLAKIDTVAASKSLARFAVFHPEANTREQAIECLAERPMHDYVPDLLQLIESPASMMMTPILDSDGNFRGYRQAFTKERMNKTDRLVVDRHIDRQQLTESVQLRRSNPFPLEEITQGFEEANEEMASAVRAAAEADAFLRQRAAEAENRFIESRNERVGKVISRIAGIAEARQPLELWKWWDRYNETNYQSFKPTSYRVDSERFAYRTYDVEVNRTCECFVAGTKVVTNLGDRPIERIGVGDMVLSRNVGTGELGWKPVLRATNRPPEETVEIQTDSDVLRCTTGHLFWVSGKGWRRASQLETGDVLHGAEKPTIVKSLRSAMTQQTFNLQVADNATYFVGKDRILTHDVTPRSHNRQSVPGEHFVQAVVEKSN